eukprot:scaffold1467_cov264-Pinguiococcus_pyrenoidosus.AAC.5
MHHLPLHKGSRVQQSTSAGEMLFDPDMRSGHVLPPAFAKLPLYSLDAPKEVEDPPIGQLCHRVDDPVEGLAHVVVERKDLPARVPGRRLEQADADALQHVAGVDEGGV